MEPARAAARHLVAQGRILITQHNRPVDPATAKGPIRLRLRLILHLSTSEQPRKCTEPPRNVHDLLSTQSHKPESEGAAETIKNIAVAFNSTKNLSKIACQARGPPK